MIKDQTIQGLHEGHFALIRTFTHGLELAGLWNKHFVIDGRHSDPRVVQQTLGRIRAEMARAARRLGRPGTARLLLLDIESLALRPTQRHQATPALMRDLAVGQSEAVHPTTTRPDKKPPVPERLRELAERQQAALGWLEKLIARHPTAQDFVATWLPPMVAERIDRAGLPTLGALVDQINQVGKRWWVGIPGIGAVKAQRIQQWLRTHASTVDELRGQHVEPGPPGPPLGQAENETTLRPLECFQIPAELDGRAGRFRAPPELCRLQADTDHEAVLAWLASKRAGKGASPGPTHRAYRKEVERLLLWSTIERRQPISSLTPEDAAAFLAFLEAPPDSWCGPRHRQRGSSEWRPLEGPLNPGARQQAVAVLRSLFKFLRVQGYVVGANPFEALEPLATAARSINADRALTVEQWRFIAASLQEDHAPGARRRARAIHWLYATGLRASELCAARCADLERHIYRDAQGLEASGWLLKVEGRGGRTRKVPVPAHLVDELARAVSLAGFDGKPDAPGTVDLPILSNLEEGSCAPLTASGLYKAIKNLFARCAEPLTAQDPAQAEHLRKASPHWLRHSHGLHMLQGRPGDPRVPLHIVQNNLGHVSIGTTAKYLRTDEEDCLSAMATFWATRPW